MVSKDSLNQPKDTQMLRDTVIQETVHANGHARIADSCVACNRAKQAKRIEASASGSLFIFLSYSSYRLEVQRHGLLLVISQRSNALRKNKPI